MNAATGYTRARAAAWAKRYLAKRGYQISRSRFHEDNVIDLRALLALPIERSKGRFVVLQIGANDGRTNDPIIDAVMARGWELYAVEPMPIPFERLKRTYAANPRVHCIRCAVDTQDGATDIYSIRQEHETEGPSVDQLTSFSREVVERHWRHVPHVGSRIESTTVPTLTLPTLIERYSIPEIDLLQIDTEGFDYEIIKMAFAAGVMPAIIAFEWVHLNKADMWSCRSDLVARGYRWMISKGDVIATRLPIGSSGLDQLDTTSTLLRSSEK